MKSLQIIGRSKDLRTSTDIFYAQITVKDYLDLVGKDFDRFDIQRTRQQYKAYERMKTDIMQGASLPAITLAINPSSVDKLRSLFESGKIEELRSILPIGDSIYILDGLQRTYILNDIMKMPDFQFKEDQKLLLEFWLEKEMKHLIYRLIVLNAGQKPMSMRHQVELLFNTMQDKIKENINDIVLISEREELKRKNSAEFPFDRVVAAYYSYLTKSAMNRRENIVVDQLNEAEILNSDEDQLNSTFFEFLKILKYYTELDKLVYRIYEDSKIEKLRGPKNWLVEEITIASFFAAIAQYSTDTKRQERVEVAIKKLIDDLTSAEENSDPLSLEILSRIREGISPKKVNVGIESRKIITNGFKEFFREEGAISFKDCWKMATS